MRILRLLAFWFATAGGGLSAQTRPAPEYPMPPAHASWESEQQSFAQQYLAVPPAGTPVDREFAAGSAEEPANHAPSEFPDERVPMAAPNLGSAGALDRAEPSERRPVTASSSPEATAPHVDFKTFETADSDEPSGAFHEEPAHAPRLLPPPVVPPRPALAEVVPPYGAGATTQSSSQSVVAAQYVGNVAANSEAPESQTEPDASGDSAGATAPEPSNATLPMAQLREPLPLEPPAAAKTGHSGRRVGGIPSAVTVIGGLGVVLGVFFVVAWGMRRAAPKALTALPSQVVEVLGRAPLSGRQQVHLLRCGSKLVLVSVTPDAVETLTEITDPVEVDRLAGLCEQTRPNSSSAVFRRVFQQYAHEEGRNYAR